MPSLLTTAPERTVERVNRSDDEATSRAPDWDRGLLRQLHTMSIVSLDKMQAPPRKAGHVVSTKVIFTSCPDPDRPCDTAEAFVIPPNATHATANTVVARLRGFILQHIRDCATNGAPHRWGGADANGTFQSIFPMGKDAFSLVKDGGQQQQADKSGGKGGGREVSSGEGVGSKSTSGGEGGGGSGVKDALASYA